MLRQNQKASGRYSCNKRINPLNQRNPATKLGFLFRMNINNKINKKKSTKTKLYFSISKLFYIFEASKQTNN